LNALVLGGNGRIAVRFRGGGAKRFIRLVDFKRKKLDTVGTVSAIEYDPYRNCRIALVTYADGEKAYVLGAKDLVVGSKIVSYTAGGDPNVGCAMELRYVPQGLEVHNVELQPGRGGQLARSAGTFARLMAIDGEKAILALPSGEIRRVQMTCRATIGVVGRQDANTRNLGKAGRSRWLGIRPTVRGNAMNPIAHPLGGGEGRTSGGRPPVSPWGKPEGVRTRNTKKPSQQLIVRRRRTSKGRR
jgi:large subunit ribosomal protein L2